jgi:hypothetical protein
VRTVLSLPTIIKAPYQSLVSQSPWILKDD